MAMEVSILWCLVGSHHPYLCVSVELYVNDCFHTKLGNLKHFAAAFAAKDGWCLNMNIMPTVWLKKDIWTTSQPICPSPFGVPLGSPSGPAHLELGPFGVWDALRDVGGLRCRGGRAFPARPGPTISGSKNPALKTPKPARTRSAITQADLTMNRTSFLLLCGAEMVPRFVQDSKSSAISAADW